MTRAERALVVKLARTVDTLAAIIVAIVPTATDRQTHEANKATFQRLATDVRRVIDELEREG